MKEKLIKISQFQKQHFVPGSAPDAKTLRKCIDDGSLPGRKIGGNYFIDMAKYEASTGNSLADKIMEAA